MFSAFDANVRALLRRIELNNREIAELQPILTEREDILREAMKQRKILEKLKEKAYEDFLLEMENEETDMIDEAALNMITHSNNSKR
jgi:flagellar FliJ protein